MGSVIELLEAFDASLGDAPGGHERALRWWEQIYDAIDEAEGWDAAAARVPLSRKGCIVLLRYALESNNTALARTVALTGMIHEGQWKKPLTPTMNDGTV